MHTGAAQGTTILVLFTELRFHKSKQLNQPRQAPLWLCGFSQDHQPDAVRCQASQCCVCKFAAKATRCCFFQCEGTLCTSQEGKQTRSPASGKMYSLWWKGATG